MLALIRELAAAASPAAGQQQQQQPRVLLAVDDYNALYHTSDYGEPVFVDSAAGGPLAYKFRRPVAIEQLSLVRDGAATGGRRRLPFVLSTAAQQQCHVVCLLCIHTHTPRHATPPGRLAACGCWSALTLAACACWWLTAAARACLTRCKCRTHMAQRM